jgi:hypothetical protein
LTVGPSEIIFRFALSKFVDRLQQSLWELSYAILFELGCAF